MKRSLIAALVVAGMLSSAWADERIIRIFPDNHGHDEEELVRSVNTKLDWLGRTTDYDTGIVDYVEIRFISPGAIQEMVMSASGLAAQIGGVVFLRDDYRQDMDGTILLHELVHIVQFHNGAFDDVRDQRTGCRKELEAYQLQITWAKSNGGLIPGAIWMMGLVSCAQGEF